MAAHTAGACFLLVLACVSVSGKKEDAFDYQLDKYYNLVDGVPNKQDIYELSNEGFEYFDDGWNEMNGGMGENGTRVFNEVRKIVKLYEKATPTSTLPPLTTESPPEDGVSTFTFTLRPSQKKIIPVVVTWKFKQHPANISTVGEIQKPSPVRTVNTTTTTASNKGQKQIIVTTPAQELPTRTKTILPLLPVNETIPMPTRKPPENAKIATTSSTDNTPKRKQRSREKANMNKSTRSPTTARLPDTKRTRKLSSKTTQTTAERITSTTVIPNKKTNSSENSGSKKSAKRLTTAHVQGTKTKSIVTSTKTQLTTAPILPTNGTSTTERLSKRKIRLNKAPRRRNSTSRSVRLTKPDQSKPTTPRSSVTVTNFTTPTTTTTRGNYNTTFSRRPQPTRVKRRRRPHLERQLRLNKRARVPSYSASTFIIPLRDSSATPSYTEDIAAALRQMSSQSTSSSRKPRLTRKKVITMEDWVFPSSSELETQFPLSFEH